MAFAAKYVAKKTLGKKVEKSFASEDPYFITIEEINAKGKLKKKTVPKPIPQGLSEHDARILAKVRKFSYNLDCKFGKILGTRVGWSSVIGLVPAAGDTVDALLALILIRTASGIDGGLPSSVKLQMLSWVALDFIIGLVPILGDYLDAYVKSNTYNYLILEQYLKKRGERNLEKQGLAMPGHAPTHLQNYDVRRSERSPAPPSQGQNNPINDIPMQEVTTAPIPKVPKAAKLPEESKGGSDWWALGGRKKKVADVESGDRVQPSQSSRSVRR